MYSSPSQSNSLIGGEGASIDAAAVGVADAVAPALGSEFDSGDGADALGDGDGDVRPQPQPLQPADSG